VNNTGVLVTIRARETHAAGQLDVAGPEDLDLHAVRVELRAAPRVCRVRDVGFVQGDEFGADEVATRLVSVLRVLWQGKNDGQSGFQTRRDAHVHVAMVLFDVGCRGPCAGLRERVGSVFSGVPELDEGGRGGRVGGHVDEGWTWEELLVAGGTVRKRRWTMVACVDYVVGVVAIVVVPVMMR
jgi:hypothetical protein